MIAITGDVHAPSTDSAAHAAPLPSVASSAVPTAPATTTLPAPDAAWWSFAAASAIVNWRWLSLAAIVLAGLVPSSLGPLNHDVAWYLYGSRRVMEGARLYVDIIDLNPPLVFFLGMPVEWVALHTGLSELTVMVLAIAAMALVAVGLAVSVFRRSHAGVDGVAYGLIAIWLVCVLIVPGFDFGQREHWLLLLLLPYCAACLVAAEDPDAARLPTGMAVGVGVLAGLAFSIKPYFLGALAVLWISVVAQRRSLRPLLAMEHRSVVAVGAAYAVFMMVITPEYVTAIVPVARAQYWAFGMSRLAILQVPDVFLALAGPLIAAVAGPAIAGHQRGGILVRQMGLLGLAFGVAYVVQGKGWAYQLLPAKAFCIIGALVLLVAFVRGRYERRHETPTPSSPRPGAAFLARTVIVGGMIVPALFFLILHGDYHFGTIRMRFENKPTTLLDLIRDKAAGRPLYVMSSSVSPAFPLVNLAGATWPYRYHHFWPLPALYRSESPGPPSYHAPEAQAPIERAFFRTVIDDLTRTPPVLLLVDRYRYKQGFGEARFDYLDYFSQDPEFRTFLRGYRLVTRIGGFDVFERLP